MGHHGGSEQFDADIVEKIRCDSEYLPGDSCTSEEDEEAKEILKNFMQFKKKVKSQT